MIILYNFILTPIRNQLQGQFEITKVVKVRDAVSDFFICYSMSTWSFEYIQIHNSALVIGKLLSSSCVVGFLIFLFFTPFPFLYGLMYIPLPYFLRSSTTLWFCICSCNIFSLFLKFLYALQRAEPADTAPTANDIRNLPSFVISSFLLLFFFFLLLFWHPFQFFLSDQW